MKILLIRHGNPNYDLDCLTELGHTQAEAAAEVLCTMGIEKIYSSSCGRAIETAQHTAQKLSLPVHTCDFIREIDWAPIEPLPDSPDTQPWGFAATYVQRNISLNDENWFNQEPISLTMTPQSAKTLGAALDAWLSTLGIVRDGYFYRTQQPAHQTVAMFCHAGAFAAATSHIFNLPLPVTLLNFPCPQTGISVIEFPETENQLAAPKLCVVGNVDHLKTKGIAIA